LHSTSLYHHYNSKGGIFDTSSVRISAICSDLTEVSLSRDSSLACTGYIATQLLLLAPLTMDPPLEAGLHNLSGLSVESISYIHAASATGTHVADSPSRPWRQSSISSSARSHQTIGTSRDVIISSQVAPLLRHSPEQLQPRRPHPITWSTPVSAQAHSTLSTNCTRILIIVLCSVQHYYRRIPDQ
jgi:hypothetical protein